PTSASWQEPFELREARFDQSESSCRFHGRRFMGNNVLESQVGAHRLMCAAKQAPPRIQTRCRSDLKPAVPVSLLANLGRFSKSHVPPSSLTLRTEPPTIPRVS